MYKYLKVLFALTIVIGLVSCLKDKNYDDRITGHDLSGAGKIIELGIINSSVHDRSIAADFKDTTMVITFLTVRLAANEVASEDIAVTIDTSGTRAQLQAYNTATGKSVVPFPTSKYTIEGNSLVVVIPKGSREGYLKIKTNPINFDPSSTYGIGFKIASVDKPGYSISGNFGSFITTIGAKNKYDGVYQVTGTLVDVTNPAFGPWLPSWEAHLVTTGANTVDVYDMEYTGGVFHPFHNAGSPTYYGAFGMVVTFDPVTNRAISMVSPYVPAANTRSARLDPSFTSYFDPATHNVIIKYFMDQPNTVSGGPRVIFTEKWTYVGPR